MWEKTGLSVCMPAWAAKNIIALVSIHALSFIFITVITVCSSSPIRFRDSLIRVDLMHAAASVWRNVGI